MNIYLIVLIAILNFSCNLTAKNSSIIYIKHTVDLPNDSAQYKNWYKIIGNSRSKFNCQKGNYASSYLCIREESKDTVIVVTRCEQNKFAKGILTMMYDNEQKDSEDLQVAVDTSIIKSFKTYKKLYGSLRIPTQ